MQTAAAPHTVKLEAPALALAAVMKPLNTLDGVSAYMMTRQSEFRSWTFDVSPADRIQPYTMFIHSVAGGCCMGAGLTPVEALRNALGDATKAVA